MESYAQILKTHELKATPQRLAILENIDHAGHISIEELFTSLNPKFPSLSLATIYKNLRSMSEVGIVNELNVPGQKNHFELVKECHFHLVCKCCGRIEDIHLDIDPLIDEARHKSQFSIENSELYLSGLCHQCQDLIPT